MLKIRPVELQRNVGETLQDVQISLVPAVFRDDPTVGWLHSHLRWNDENPERWPGGPAFKLIGEVGKTFVQPKMVYYHSVLMDLGTQFELAEEGIKTARSVLLPENLSRSTVDARELAPNEFWEGWVEEIAANAVETWRKRREFIASCWNIWREEVRDLRRSAERATATLDGVSNISDLISTAMRVSALNDFGYPEKREFDLGRVLGTLALAGVTKLGSLDDGRRGESVETFLDNITRSIEGSQWDYNRVLERQARVPLILAQQNALELEYEDRDPFEAYRSVTVPADQLLAHLAAHNTLAGTEPSRWLWEFTATLPRLDTSVLPRSLEVDGESYARRVRWGVLTADAAIKLGVVNHFDLMPITYAPTSTEAGC
ncbi:hypothetical protein LZK77_16310 [Rhizobium leguminosarum]|nr:hypothetical protein LZK77_16310 [Rhizobium leguminosarum]